MNVQLSGLQGVAQRDGRGWIDADRALALLQAAHDSMFVHDLSHRILFWNRSAEQMYGWSHSEAVGQVATELLHTQFPLPLEQVKETLLASGTWEGELVHTTRDGKQIVVESRWALYRDAAGEPEAILQTNRDITEKKRQAEEIALLNTRLGTLVTETHHRIKTTLQSRAALIDVMEASEENSQCSETLGRLAQHVRGLGVIHELLTDESKHGNAGTLSAVTTLGRLIANLRLGASGRPINVDIEDEQLPVRQSTALTILLNELITNALKYGKGDIDVSFSVRGEGALLVVEDQGPGFAPGFMQCKDANTGLELVANICRYDLEGTVAFGNRPEGGARVEVSFPLRIPFQE